MIGLEHSWLGSARENPARTHHYCLGRRNKIGNWNFSRLFSILWLCLADIFPEPKQSFLAIQLVHSGVSSQQRTSNKGNVRKLELLVQSLLCNLPTFISPLDLQVQIQCMNKIVHNVIRLPCPRH